MSGIGLICIKNLIQDIMGQETSRALASEGVDTVTEIQPKSQSDGQKVNPVC